MEERIVPDSLPQFEGDLPDEEGLWYSGLLEIDELSEEAQRRIMKRLGSSMSDSKNKKGVQE
jgi:hypothetical protein